MGWLGWFVGALVVHGLGLWRAGRKGLAFGAWVATQGVLAVPLTLYTFDPLRWAWALAPAGALHGLLLFGQAVWGARLAGRATERSRWWSVLLFALVVFGANSAANLPVIEQMTSFKVPSGSMRPTLLEGDQFFAMHDWERFPIERGSVVVFERGGTHFVKRVVGLPGDRVAWDGTTLSVMLPEAPDAFIPLTTEDGCDDADPGLTCLRETNFQRQWHIELRETHRLTGEWAVPPDHVFVMGDNRDNSEDSRVFGPVSLDTVVGCAVVLHWPPARAGRRLDGLE